LEGGNEVNLAVISWRRPIAAKRVLQKKGGKPANLRVSLIRRKSCKFPTKRKESNHKEESNLILPRGVETSPGRKKKKAPPFPKRGVGGPRTEDFSSEKTVPEKSRGVYWEDRNTGTSLFGGKSGPLKGGPFWRREKKCHQGKGEERKSILSLSGILKTLK